MELNGVEETDSGPRIEIGRVVERPFPLFMDRTDAGHTMAEFVRPSDHSQAVVLAVPRGGVPVAAPMARAFGIPLDVMPVRKLPIPRSPEAGFGAVAPDGSTVLNEAMVEQLGLPAEEIARIREEVLDEVVRRAEQYRGERRPPDLEGRHVYLVDDGLASGYTMLAAVRSARQAGGGPITLCVPVSPMDSLRRLEPHVDEVFCFVAQQRPPFAVASFYREFGDLTDEGVKQLLAGGPAGPGADTGPVPTA